MLRCQKCGNGYEYAGPQLKSNPLIHCPHCDKPTRATVMLLLNRGDVIFTPLRDDQRIKRPAQVEIETPKKTQLSVWGERPKFPRPFIPMPEMCEDARAIFSHYVKQLGPDDCWVWQGSKDDSNYGKFYLRGKLYVASRVAYWISRGVDPGQFMVGHSCDNPPCCNPKHLFVTDAQGNALDKAIKGRCHAQTWSAQ